MSTDQENTGRREFLKKAGTVAWIVPTVQVVNMAAAAGGDDGTTGSVVPTTTTRPTNPPPECSCDLEILDFRFLDDGAAFKVGVALSPGCQGRADNVSLSLTWDGGEETTNHPLMDYYWVEMPPDHIVANLLVEIHDSEGRILTSCDIRLEVLI